jgi:hypothetical protein
MRVLRPVVFPKPLLMSTGQSQTSERAGVGAQLVGDQQFRHEALLLEQLTHQPQGRPTIAAALDQHVENFALVIDGTPQIQPLAGDAHHHLVQMPAIARPRTSLNKVGVDFGYLQGGVMVWSVVASTVSLAPGSLSGSYGGVTASATVGIGVGANVLVGGSGNSIALQPVSVEGTTGLDVAAGLAEMTVNFQPS